MCGCHEAGLPIIQGLLDVGIKFDYFVILSPEQGKKYQVAGYFDFSNLANSHKIPIYYPKTYNLEDASDQKFFTDNQFDLLIQGGWQRLFPDTILQTLKCGAIGVHGSPDFLPKGRGRSPLNWSLIENRKRFILQLFLMKSGVDDGDIFDYESFDINEFDTIRTLYYKVGIVSRNMLLRSLPLLLAGKVVFIPQKGEPSYYSKRSPSDGQIDWETMDVWDIYNAIRAQTRPYPGAFGKINENIYTIWQAQVFDTQIKYPGEPYGSIVESFDNCLVINCRGGLLLATDYELKTEI